MFCLAHLWLMLVRGPSSISLSILLFIFNSNLTLDFTYIYIFHFLLLLTNFTTFFYLAHAWLLLFRGCCSIWFCIFNCCFKSLVEPKVFYVFCSILSSLFNCIFTFLHKFSNNHFVLLRPWFLPLEWEFSKIGKKSRRLQSQTQFKRLGDTVEKD